MNERIRVREIRVIDDAGEQLGIMPPQQALALARSKGLDLVEVAAAATPPVCRIMDFGKYQYQEQKRTREARKHQVVIEVKEIKFRPKVDEHDYLFKKKHIERFLADGDKVKATIFFRGREMAHPEIGQRILERLLLELADVAVPENMPRREGNTMHVILGRKGGGKGHGAPKPARPAPSGLSALAVDISGDLHVDVPVDDPADAAVEVSVDAVDTSEADHVEEPDTNPTA